MKKIHILLFVTAILFSSCASKKNKNVTYLKGTENKKEQPTLNIFTPRN
jgi:PBP1b-binding outer membrane lipoprotein LpoB